MVNSNRTSLSLTSICLTALLCSFAVSQVLSANLKRSKGLDADKFSELFNDGNFADGTLGNSLPKEAWWQSQCLQPSTQPDCSRWSQPSTYFSYDILSRRCRANYGESCFKQTDNYFLDRASCEDSCMRNEYELTCSLLPEPGYRASIDSCNLNTYRWFYTKGDCYQFVYTGCGGNMNNFPNRNSCLNYCSGKGEANNSTSSLIEQIMQDDEFSNRDYVEDPLNSEIENDLKELVNKNGKTSEGLPQDLIGEPKEDPEEDPEENEITDEENNKKDEQVENNSITNEDPSTKQPAFKRQKKNRSNKNAASDPSSSAKQTKKSQKKDKTDSMFK